MPNKTKSKSQSQPKPKAMADAAPTPAPVTPDIPEVKAEQPEPAAPAIDPIEEARRQGKETYTFPANEKDLYHVRMSLKNSFDPITGKPTMKPFIQKFDQKIWRVVYDTYVAQGYNLEILYDPTKH